MFWQTILPATLLAVRPITGFTPPMAMTGLMGHEWADLERRMEHFAEEGDIPAHTVIKRQSVVTTVQTNADGTMNMTAWDQQAAAACVSSLSTLKASTNPSGTCVCYNLPALNNQTGEFFAELRLYQISAARGDFAGIPQSSIQVSLKYDGASVSPISADAAAKMVVARQTTDATTGATTGTATGTTTANNLQLLQTYMFAGQIDMSRMTGTTSLSNRALLEAMVMPIVTLSAVNNAGQPVSTVVSSNEAAFVAGEFSNETVMSSFAMANMAVDMSLIGLGNASVPFENKTQPFVLPGVALMIYPIGLIITSVWTVGLAGAVGFGTFQRMGFRDSYKSRLARAGKGAQPRI